MTAKHRTRLARERHLVIPGGAARLRGVQHATDDLESVPIEHGQIDDDRGVVTPGAAVARDPESLGFSGLSARGQFWIPLLSDVSRLGRAKTRLAPGSPQVLTGTRGRTRPIPGRLHLARVC